MVISSKLFNIFNIDKYIQIKFLHKTLTKYQCALRSFCMCNIAVN